LSPVLNKAQHHADVWVSGGIASDFLNLSTKWTWVVNFTLQNFYPQGYDFIYCRIYLKQNGNDTLQTVWNKIQSYNKFYSSYQPHQMAEWWFNHLTRLVPREEFIIHSCRESSRSHKIKSSLTIFKALLKFYSPEWKEE
jgi:hypothetical protein